MSKKTKFYFKPAPGEQIETKIQIDHDLRSSIYGTVVDLEGAPISGALALLFRAGEAQTPLSQFYTDEDGQFVFGDLFGDTLYLIKIFRSNRKIRELEIMAE